MNLPSLSHWARLRILLYFVEKMFSLPRFTFFLLLFFAHFSVAQSGVRSKDHPAFGAPERWSGLQLPTYIEVAKHFLHKQAELIASHGKVPMWVVASKVRSYSNGTFFCLDKTR